MYKLNNVFLLLGRYMYKLNNVFFIAMHTISNMLTWTIVLLAIHQDWQQMARKQVLDLSGNDALDKDSLNQLRIVRSTIVCVIGL